MQSNTSAILEYDVGLNPSEIKQIFPIKNIIRKMKSRTFSIFLKSSVILFLASAFLSKNNCVRAFKKVPH